VQVRADVLWVTVFLRYPCLCYVWSVALFQPRQTAAQSSLYVIWVVTCELN